MGDIGRWEDVGIMWLDKDNYPEGIATMQCPVCKKYTTTIYYYGNPTDGMNYCPHCGDQMKGEK